MKTKHRILFALMLVVTMLVGITVVSSAAKTTTDTTIYLTPNTNWKADNARFALYTWDGGDKWFDMKDSDGDGVYECVIPSGIENIIFCRMNPNASANNWNNKWNQTADLKYDGKNNHYTVKEGTWDKGGGSWTLIEMGECIHTPSGNGNVITASTCTTDGVVSHTCSKCNATYEASLLATGHSYGANGKCSSCGAMATYTIAGTGAHLGTEWDTSNTANDMTFADGVYTKVYTNVAAGSYMFKCAQDHSWNVAYPDADKSYAVGTAGSTVTITLNASTHAVNVVVSAPGADPEVPAAPIYTVVGDVMQVNSVYVTGVNFFGTSWDVANVDNKLEYNEELCAYVKVFSGVSVGEYHFKVVENMSWDVNYGANGAVNGTENCYVNVTVEGSKVTIIFKDLVPTAVVEAPETPVIPPHEHNFVEGKCECGETDPNYVPPHEHNFVEGKCECGETDPNYVEPKPETPDYYLIGYINGANYGCEDDHANLGEYKFVDGSLTVSFESADNYVFIKTGDNAKWYMSAAYCTDTTVTLANTNAGTSEKMYVPGGVQLVFTLVENEDGTLTLSYVSSQTPVDPPHEHNFVEGKCECGETDPNYVPPHEHNFVEGKCECGETDPNYTPNVPVDYTIAGGAAGDNPSAGFLGTRWDTTNTDNDLVKGENGIYSKVYENVAAGEYELKIAENHSWDVSYGADGGSNNYWFKVDNDGSTVTVTFDPETKLINVTVDYTAPVVPPHEHNFVEGKCECGESDPNYIPPHEHNFVEGKCECGESDPNYVPPTEEEPKEETPDEPATPEQPAPELSVFQKILKAITDFFANIGVWFKNLLA